MSYVSHEELIELAGRHGYQVEWDHRGWARLRNGDGTVPVPYYSPPNLLRKSLLPKGHPEAVKIRPGLMETN